MDGMLNKDSNTNEMGIDQMMNNLKNEVAVESGHLINK